MCSSSARTVLVWQVSAAILFLSDILASDSSEHLSFVLLRFLASVLYLVVFLFCFVLFCFVIFFISLFFYGLACSVVFSLPVRYSSTSFALP